MAKIPLVVTALQVGRREDVRDLLIAAIMRSEDEMLQISDADMQKAKDFKIITHVDDTTGDVTLIAEPKK